MRKILVVASLLLAGTVLAQGPAGVIIFAGPQITSTNYRVEGVNQESEHKYGFQLGVGLKAPFEQKLYFAPQAFYSLKGYKVNFTRFAAPPDSTAINNNTSIHTFEIAPMLQYDFSETAGHFFIRLGPSLDFQLFGKEKFEKRDGNVVDRSMKFSTTSDYGRFSANLLAQVGYETMSGFSMHAQYTHGAASINNEDLGPAIRHRAYGITVGKILNRKKIVIDTKNRE